MAPGGLKYLLLASTLILCPFSLAKPLWRRTGVVPSLSGSANVISTGTYPRANFLSDGITILGATTVYDSTNTTITLSTSTNSGVSWTQVGTAATGFVSESDIDNPYPLQLPSGRILIAFRNHDRDSSTGPYTYYRITICYSDDNGASWQYLSTPASGVPPNGIWEPFLRMASDGTTIQLYYSEELSSADQNTMMTTSTDGGVTWAAAVTITGGDLTDARDGMSGVTPVDTTGQNLLLIFETEQNGLFTVNCMTSADDGATWTDRHNVYTPTGTDNNAGSPQVILVGTTLVATFMTDEDTSEHAWTSGADAKVVTSSDGGVTWGDKLTFSQVQSNWPGLLVLTDSSFLGMADDGGAKAQLIELS